MSRSAICGTSMSHQETLGDWKGFAKRPGLVDLLQQADQVPARDAELEGGAAAIAGVPRESGQNLLALEEAHLSAQAADRVGIGGRGTAGIQEPDQRRAVDQ